MNYDIKFILRGSALVLSILCLTTQIVLLIRRQKFRHVDQKILTAITITYTLDNIIHFSYLIRVLSLRITSSKLTFQFVTGVFTAIDMALLIWMCVFTRNFYDRFVRHLKTDKWNVIKIFLGVSCMTLPWAVLSFLSYFFSENTIFAYTMMHVIIKCSVVSLSVVYISRVLYVIVYTKTIQPNNITVHVRAAVGLTLFLVILTGLEEWTTFIILVLTKFVYIEDNVIGSLVWTFLNHLNTFQVAVLTVIFVLLKPRIKECDVV